jgi:hypothetical protein
MSDVSEFVRLAKRLTRREGDKHTIGKGGPDEFDRFSYEYYDGSIEMNFSLTDGSLLAFVRIQSGNWESQLIYHEDKDEVDLETCLALIPKLQTMTVLDELADL